MKFKECAQLYPKCKTPQEEESEKVGFVEIEPSLQTKSNKKRRPPMALNLG